MLRPFQPQEDNPESTKWEASRFGRSGEEINSLPLTGLEHRIIQPISRFTADFSREFLTFHRYGLQTPFYFYRYQ